MIVCPIYIPKFTLFPDFYFQNYFSASSYLIIETIFLKTILSTSLPIIRFLSFWDSSKYMNKSNNYFFNSIC